MKDNSARVLCSRATAEESDCDGVSLPRPPRAGGDDSP